MHCQGSGGWRVRVSASHHLVDGRRLTCCSIVSTQHVLNVLQKEHPDVVRTLATPNWYFDRKGEQSEGEEPYYKSSVIYLENDPQGSPRVFARLDPNNVTSLARYVIFGSAKGLEFY